MNKPGPPTGSLSAQSDDCYSRISFESAADGDEVEGTLGWREGMENRVVFSVWDGPSFAAEGDDLAAAFAVARAGILRAGFTPLAPADGSLDELFVDDEMDDMQSPPRVEPILWLLVAAILLAILIPALAQAEQPVVGEAVSFPDASYLWRYDGPDFDSRSNSPTSAAQQRAEAKMAGRPEPDLDPHIVILDGESEAVIVRYELEGGSFCVGEEDNCELDGIFPIVLASAPKEPVLGVVTHVGAHSQRISVLRPLADKAKPVFEATAEYALTLKLMPDGLTVEMDQADKDGNISREHRPWIAGDAGQCKNVDFDPLPAPPAPTREAADLENTLRHIARMRDLPAFVELLADDVLVSFGGNGGKQEFLSSLKPNNGEEAFWKKLDKLLAAGGWNDADKPQSMTWPWFFSAWPENKDAFDAFIAGPDVLLHAGPNENAPVLATPGFGALRFAAPDVAAETVDWHAIGWLPIAAPGHCLGYVRVEDVTHLLDTRLVARQGKSGWKIEAFVAGD